MGSICHITAHQHGQKRQKQGRHGQGEREAVGTTAGHHHRQHRLINNKKGPAVRRVTVVSVMSMSLTVVALSAVCPQYRNCGQDLFPAATTRRSCASLLHLLLRRRYDRTNLSPYNDLIRTPNLGYRFVHAQNGRCSQASQGDRPSSDQVSFHCVIDPF